LNLRPLGPEPSLIVVHAVAASGTPSQALDSTEGGAPEHVEGLPTDPPNGTGGTASADRVAADLRRTEYLRPEGLLPVRAVAERLGLSAATVHNDINAGRLRWVLFGSVRRVRPEDLEEYARVRSPSPTAAGS
jgi:excisionase family DNA binding protein